MKANTLLQQISKLLPLTTGGRIIPIIACIKFDGDNTFSATDMRNYMDVSINDTGINTPFCVDASKFTNILKGFRDKELKFKVTDKDITIKSDKSKYKLPIEPVDDFPTIKGDFNNATELDGTDLYQAINDTSFAVSRDELRPAMCGICFTNNKVVSTDAHRLVESNYLHGLNFILPVSCATLISNNISDKAIISDNSTHIKIDLGNIIIHTRKIEEKFPDYKMVVPTSFNHSYIFNTEDMEQVVKRLLLTANSNTSAIVFELSSDSGCIAYSSDVDFGIDGHEQLEGDYIGDGIKIGFNGKFILDALRSINQDQLVLKLNTPNKAGVIECNNKIVLLMPVVVN